MQIIQSQGVHHLTFIGADRRTSLDFWEGVLGMPFIFEQPNLDVPEESHLYFDPGDGRLITIFTREDRQPDATPTPEVIGALHHVAFTVSRATYLQAAQRLRERGVPHSGEVDRGFMDSLYFRDPLGQLFELSSYKFEPPVGFTHADVLVEAHKLRVVQGDTHITEVHLASAIEALMQRGSRSLSDDRGPRNPYHEDG
jgi:catechol 2,3-dioxygenase-like lactoylglutathione lyase family enzyme